jgi:hypothetical protein
METYFNRVLLNGDSEISHEPRCSAYSVKCGATCRGFFEEVGLGEHAEDVFEG